MTPRTLAICTMALMGFAACGSNTPPAPSPGSGGAITITGSERLGWDQQAANSAELASFRYALYVDGIRFEMSGVLCSTTPGRAGFSCSGSLPHMSAGSHTLELATFVTGETMLESVRSAPLVITVAAPATQAAETKQVTGVFETPDGVHLDLELVAEGFDMPTDLAVAPDGRVFVAERGGRVRVVRDGRVNPRAALILDDVFVPSTGGGLLAIGLDPQFARTRFMYVLHTAIGRNGTPVFRLARFREAGETFAEGAFLIADVPASAEHPSGFLRFGPDAKMYVAFDDGGDPQQSARLSSFYDKILRLNADGSTPADQAASSPVYAVAKQPPRAFDWHPVTDDLWTIAGNDGDAERLSAIVDDRGRTRRASIRTAYALPPDMGAFSMAFYRGLLISAFRNDLFVAANQGGYLLRVRFDANDPMRIAAIQRLLQDRVDSVRTVAVAPDGIIYLCTRSALLRLTPARTR